MPSPVLEGSSAKRPALVVTSMVSVTSVAPVAVATPGARSINFVEASAPVSLNSLRYNLREATSTPATASTSFRPEAVAAGFGNSALQAGEPVEPVTQAATSLNRNSMLAMTLAALGLAALAAARAPAHGTNGRGAEVMPNEPARR